jgi:hypothetical protein
MTNKSATNLRDVGIIATIVLVSVILLKFSLKDDSIKVAPAGASAAVAAANQSVVNPSSQIAGDFKEESANLTDTFQALPESSSESIANISEPSWTVSRAIDDTFKEESANLTDTFQALPESSSESIANVSEPSWIVSRAIDDTVVTDVPPEIEATSGTVNSGTSGVSDPIDYGGSSGGTGGSSSGDSSDGSATGERLTGGDGTSGDSTSSGSGSTDAVSSGQDSTGVTTTTGGGGSSGGDVSVTSGDYVNISPSQLSKDLAVEQSKRLQHILSFFKTPTKQFMPLGFYGLVGDIRDVEILETLHQRGIILFHIYDGTQSIESALTDLQSAQEAGVGILQNLPRMYLDRSKPIYHATENTYFNAEEIEYWQQRITALASNDQILVWYLPEEAKENELDKLEQIGNIIRATDTKHRPLITYVCDSDAEYLKRVSGITDAVVYGWYTSLHGSQPRIDIKRRIDWAYQNGVSVVIASLEALEGKFNWVRPKDVRFDAYLSLISGAKGIMWYAYGYAKPNTELMEAVLEVADELNGSEGLGEVLLSGKEPKSLKCRLLEGPALSPPTSIYEHKQYDSVQWTAREYENYLYIFAVNTAQKVETGAATDDGGAAYMIKVKFGPISSPSSKIQIIGESRVVDLSDGYFIDTFEPLGTHIYKVKLD